MWVTSPVKREVAGSSPATAINDRSVAQLARALTYPPELVPAAVLRKTMSVFTPTPLCTHKVRTPDAQAALREVLEVLRDTHEVNRANSLKVRIREAEGIAEDYLKRSEGFDFEAAEMLHRQTI
jgi:hypothetical protein